MDEHEFIQMMGTGARKPAGRTWRCPSPERIAAYLDQSLEPKDRSRFEAHLADCDFCLDMVGGLIRQRRVPEPPDVPAFLLQKAICDPAMKSGWRISRRWVLVPALASIVAVSAILLTIPHSQKYVASLPAPAADMAQTPAMNLPEPQRPADEYVRGLNTTAPQLQVVEPQPGSVLRKDALRFRWETVGTAAYYEVRVVDSEGDLVLERQESGPAAQLPPNMRLEAGRYFVWVRAYLHDGRTVKSQPVPFTIVSK